MERIPGPGKGTGLVSINVNDHPGPYGPQAQLTFNEPPFFRLLCSSRFKIL